MQIDIISFYPYLVIYSALEQYRNDDLKAHLAEKFPGLNVQIMYMPTAKVAAKRYCAGD